MPLHTSGNSDGIVWSSSETMISWEKAEEIQSKNYSSGTSYNSNLTWKYAGLNLRFCDVDPTPDCLSYVSYVRMKEI